MKKNSVLAIKGAAIGRKPEAGPQYGEIQDDGKSYTLNSTEVHAVAVPLEEEDEWTADVASTLGEESNSARKSSSGQMVDFCIVQSQNPAFGGNNTSGEIDVATAQNAKGGSGRMDFESETLVLGFSHNSTLDIQDDISPPAIGGNGLDVDMVQQIGVNLVF